ncbi:hypothetical protein ACLOJK_014831 [Asimina triloba]
MDATGCPIARPWEAARMEMRSGRETEAASFARRSRPTPPFSSPHLLPDSGLTLSPSTSPVFTTAGRVSPIVSSSPACPAVVSPSLSPHTVSSPLASFPTPAAVNVSPVVFSIPDRYRRFPLSLSLSPPYSFFSARPIPDPDRRLYSPSLSLSLHNVFSDRLIPDPDRASCSLFSSGAGLSSHHLLRRRPLDLWLCLSLASSPATTKLFTNRTLS